ncbi:MAG: hypothetical protein IJ313_06465 [Clostridia bacterium]|nr:hypothetical protein [Clostridia bacterium]
MLEILSANLPIGLCLLMGAGLMIVEIFLPGFGLPGISGIVLIAAGVILTAIYHGTFMAVVILLVVIALLALVISWVLRSAAKGNYHSEIFLSEKDELHSRQDMQVLVGRKGRTASVLRPAGIGNFDGVRLNVVTEGSFIERDMPIEIVSVDGARIVVRPMQED